MLTTPGRLLLEDAVPEDMRDRLPVFTKSSSGKFFKELAEKHPDQYADTLYKLTHAGAEAAEYYGREASIGTSDLSMTPEIRKMREQVRGSVDRITQDSSLTPEQKKDRVIAYMKGVQDKIRKDTVDSAVKHNNAMALAAKYGFRGNPTQLTQLLFGDLLVADHKGDPVPVPGLTGYGQGVSPTEYFAGSYGARTGAFSVQLGTAQGGYYAKLSHLASQRLKVTGEDCGAWDQGLEKDGDSEDLLGYVLAKDTAGIPSGTPIGKEHLQKLSGKKVLVRSLVTCQQPEGVCQLCSGKREQGKYPSIGAHVGITASMDVTEPVTQQLALSAKHVGGTVGVTDKKGIEELQQFTGIPQHFVGAAALAQEDGVVKDVKKAPQGGHYITLNTGSAVTRAYVPEGRKVTVKQGDSLEAGDIMSDGTPNPAEIVKYKGLGEGRRYAASKLSSILKENGVKANDRNVEALVAGWMNRVRITDPDGYKGWRYDELIPYNRLRNQWKPREDSEDMSPAQARGRFLEKPVLHYTIGTRVTPSMANKLENQGIRAVTVNSKPPPFEPEAVRLMAVPETDPDWKVKLTGYNLKKTLTESATLGSFAENKSTSPAAELMNPTML